MKPTTTSYNYQENVKYMKFIILAWYIFYNIIALSYSFVINALTLFIW